MALILAGFGVSVMAMTWVFAHPASSAPRICSTPEIPKVRVAIVEPEEGETVHNPIRFRVKVVKPRGCDATYAVFVDDVPYQTTGPRPQNSLKKNSRSNPSYFRPRPNIDVNFSCISTGEHFGVLRVEPGKHVFRLLHRCSGGTSVPQTVSRPRHFVVAKENTSSLPATGPSLLRWTGVGISLMSAGWMLRQVAPGIPSAAVGQPFRRGLKSYPRSSDTHP